MSLNDDYIFLGVGPPKDDCLPLGWERVMDLSNSMIVVAKKRTELTPKEWTWLMDTPDRPGPGGS